MNYTIIGDIHAKPDNLDKVNKLFDIIEDLANPVIVLGDLLDTKEVIRGKCLNTYFTRLQNSKLPFYILVGNHDYFNLNCEEHSLEVLKNLNNVTIVDALFTLESSHKKLILIPFIQDLEVLKNVLKTKGDYLFGHLDMLGFDYGNGIISKKGLQIQDFKNFQKVISGHYHSYQAMDNFIYLGSPFSHTFGESNQEKFIGLINTDTGNLELLDSPFPKHITIDVNCDVDNSINLDMQNYNRLILRGGEQNIKAFKKVSGVKYVEQPTNFVNKKVVINESQSPQTQFKLWAKDIKRLEDSTCDLGLEYLNNV